MHPWGWWGAGSTQLCPPGCWCQPNGDCLPWVGAAGEQGAPQGGWSWLWPQRGSRWLRAQERAGGLQAPSLPAGAGVPPARCCLPGDVFILATQQRGAISLRGCNPCRKQSVIMDSPDKPGWLSPKPLPKDFLSFVETSWG